MGTVSVSVAVDCLSNQYPLYTVHISVFALLLISSSLNVLPWPLPGQKIVVRKKKGGGGGGRCSVVGEFLTPCETED